MQVEVIMPKMGESIQEGTVIRWMKKIGEKIQKDETLLEISTDKVDSEIPSPVNGTMAKIFASEQETVPVGTVIALIETDLSVSIDSFNITKGELRKAEEPDTLKISPHHQPSSLHDQKPQSSSQRFYSPVVQAVALREGLSKIDLEQIVGSGSNGRVTKNDILSYLAQRERLVHHLTATHRPAIFQSSDIAEIAKKYPAPQYHVVKMNTLQRKMAEHMSRSVAVSPHVTIVDEVDMNEIVNFRLSILEKFDRQHGFKLTYTHFLAYAVVSTLKEFPIVNSSLEGDAILYKNFINLGLAVASPHGLIVPVVRNAEEKNFKELARSLVDVAERAKAKKLKPDDITNGTFSITNYGVFGSIVGTPIINQPQVAILGVGSIKKRPVVVQGENGNESVQVRPMVYLTLSFDHRVIDGAAGGKFLSRVKWYLEHFNFQLVN
jgi:2-oxoglutarate dehydrogenase complex dihydrolipoamide succinyltransferase (E2) component